MVSAFRFANNNFHSIQQLDLHSPTLTVVLQQAQ